LSYLSNGRARARTYSLSLHDALPIFDLHREPVRTRPADGDAAAHVRAHAHGDVAADGADIAGQVDGDQADRAVHGAHVAADAAAAVDEDAAVHRLHVATDARARADADLAVDRGQAVGDHVVAGVDAAVDGLGVLDLGAGLDGDAAVDGFHVAVGAPGLGHDAAVDLADVLLRQRRRGRQQRAAGQHQEGGYALHVRISRRGGAVAAATVATVTLAYSLH